MQQDNYIIAEINNQQIIGKVKESYSGAEESLVKNKKLVLVGPYWSRSMTSPQTNYKKYDQEMFIKEDNIVQRLTEQQLKNESFEILL